MIIMEDVTKTYSTGVAALNGINLHIQKGEFVFIVGKSGSGKSTLIKLLLKELDPIIEEMRCNSNKGFELIPPFEIVVSRNNLVIDLGSCWYIIPANNRPMISSI